MSYDYLRDHSQFEQNKQVQLATKAESDAITKLSRFYNCNILVDIGTWYGFLASDLLSSPSSCFTDYYGIEGNPVFCDYTRLKITDSNCKINWNVHNYIIVSNANKVNNFRLNLADSSKSGLDSNGLLIKGIPKIKLSNFFKVNNLISLIDKVYLKTDLEGADFDVILELLSDGLRPKVLHFEVLRRTREKYEEFMKILLSYGYQVCKLPSREHRFFSCIVSPNGCHTIGFDPLNTYL